MRLFISLFMLFSSTYAMAANLPPLPTLEVGGQTFLNPSTATGFKVLIGNVTTSAEYATMRETNGTAGYVVPALKTFKVFAVRCNSNSGADTTTLGYGDTDVGFRSGSAPTSPVYISGDSSLGIVSIPSSTTPPPVGETGLANGFSVPAGKYPFMAGFGNQNITCFFYGVES